MQLDECLDFNDHTNYIIDKATKTICVIRKSRDFISQHTALTLYKSLVLPHFEYCSLVYECTSKHNLNRLQLIRNQGCLVILRADRYESVNNMHTTLKLKHLDERRSIKMALECPKYVYQAESSLTSFFKKKNTGRQTRHSNSMLVDKTRTDFGRRAFSIRGPDYWNKLLENITQINNFNKFKSSVMRTFATLVDHPM